MLLGTPMVQAMEPLSEIVSSSVSADHTQSLACCMSVRSLHEAKATANNNQARTLLSMVVDIPRTIFHFSAEILRKTIIPPKSPGFPQFTLVGSTIKRE
jgi:hypothetical protein